MHYVISFLKVQITFSIGVRVSDAPLPLPGTYLPVNLEYLLH